MAGRGTDIMLGGNVTYMAKAALKKELCRELTANLAELKDAYEHQRPAPRPRPSCLPRRKSVLMPTPADDRVDGHGETEDENILAVRKRFEELYAQYKPAISAEAEEVRKAGGLFIIGTERHESRRIDNQLRGRAGRQGDPGASRFYLSLEDDLMRLFGGDRVSRPDGYPRPGRGYPH